MATHEEVVSTPTSLTPAKQPGVFLTAAWRNLVMLNYEVDRALLDPFVPAGTELDLFAGQALVSLVGFQFLDTRVLGVPVPFHRRFEELNLRFYVRRQCGDELRRGVVFIKEIVPRIAVSTIARLVYQENYVTMPMRHEVIRRDANSHVATNSPQTIEVAYRWNPGPRWNELRATGQGEPAFPAPGSAEEFITEHYWGYTALRDGRAAEYRVEHPQWRLWRATTASLDCDAALLYGPGFARCLAGSPHSAFLVDGSPVSVRRGSCL